MEGEVLIISQEQISSLRTRLERGGDLDGCIKETERMLHIESGVYWRTDARSCCFGDSLPLLLYSSVQILGNMLHKLRSDDINGAISLLDEYEKTILSKDGFHGGGR